MTWLNPHVYLDTVFLLGSVAADRGPLRWTFGLGAVCASLCWFAALGFGARLLSRFLARPAAWRGPGRSGRRDNDRPRRDAHRRNLRLRIRALSRWCHSDPLIRKM